KIYGAHLQFERAFRVEHQIDQFAAMRRNEMAVRFCTVDIHDKNGSSLSFSKAMVEPAKDKHRLTRIHACLFVIRVSSVSICGWFPLAAPGCDLTVYRCPKLVRQRTIPRSKAT